MQIIKEKLNNRIENLANDMSKQFSEEKNVTSPQDAVFRNQGNTKCTMSFHIYHIGGKRILTRSGIMGILVHWGSLGTGV